MVTLFIPYISTIHILYTIHRRWVKFTLVGMFGDNIWRRKWQRAIDQGILNLDPYYILTELIIPIVIICLDYLLTPYFISRIVCIYILYDSYYQQTLVTRFSFIVYFIIRQVNVYMIYMVYVCIIIYVYIILIYTYIYCVYIIYVMVCKICML